MSQFTRTNGDFKPVAVFDDGVTSSGAGSSTGVNAVVSAATVQPQGPKLDFFTVTKDTGALSTSDVNAIVQTVQQLATIYIYEYTDASNDTFAMAVYPTAAWDATALDTAITAAGVAVTVAATATFTN
jgi:hypothetical protein